MRIAGDDNKIDNMEIEVYVSTNVLLTAKPEWIKN